MPDNKPDIHISTDRMQCAYYTWCQLSLIENNRGWAVFWDYVGDNLQSDQGGWLLTPDGARRIDYLLSPYAETMVKAWFKIIYKPKQNPLPQEVTSP